MLIALVLVTSVFGQTDSIPAPPYKRFPTVPPFRLLLGDSATWYTKEDLPRKRPVLIMVFSPDCEHCKHETEEIIKNIKEFKKIQIVMATFLPLDKMKKFYGFFELYRYENIVVGRDENFILAPFYNLRNMPFLAFYDKKGNLIDVNEGNLPVDKILEKFADKD